MVINIASYHAAYVVCLGVALAITTSRGEARLPVLLVSVLFLAFSVAVTGGLLFLSGRDVDRVTAKLTRFPALRNALVFLKDADPQLTRHSQLLVEAMVWQAVIFLLDAASMTAFQVQVKTRHFATARGVHQGIAYDLETTLADWVDCRALHWCDARIANGSAG